MATRVGLEPFTSGTAARGVLGGTPLSSLPAAIRGKVLVTLVPWQTLAVGTPFEVVGRRAELAKLTGFIEGPERPTVVAVVGAAGMGKTTLWTAAVCTARDRGWTVLSARPSGAEASLSFAGLSDLFAAVDEEVLARIPAVQRKALEVALLRSERDDGAADARAVSTGVLSLLQEIAVGAPVLVAVDDITWLDRATASALGFALRRLEGSRTMLLATVREDEIRTNAVTGVAAPGGWVELLLRPLAAGTLRRILDLRFGDEMSHNTTVVAACGGNPLFAIEIAQELLRQGQRPGAGPLPVPGELRQLLTYRVNRMPARARDALLVAACLASPRTGLVDASAIEPAEDAGLVTIETDGRVRFTHPLLAAAVYESAPPSRRRSVHRMLGGRLEDPEERARHLALGSEGPDLEIAGHLDEAAKLAQARGSPAAAAELVELALQMTPPVVGAGRAERMLTGAALHFETGDLSRAQELVEQGLSEALGSSLRASGLRLLAQLRSRRGTFGEAAQLASEALEVAGAELAITVGLHLDLVFYFTSLADFPRALPHADAAVAGSGELGHAAIEAEALAVKTVVRFLSGQGLAGEDLARALAIEDPTRATLLLMRPRL